ncbi:MAG: adenylate/guanylate cyclase domain-containing protein [Rhodoferax sp.]
MGDQRTVVFTDLHGSTAVFESLGNARATEVITGHNAFITHTVKCAGGSVIKTLGDGVLAIFDHPQAAIDMVIELQRDHAKRLQTLAEDSRLPLRIGVAFGEVEWVAGDCYGDAVNVASRLCDLCGPNQIWANDLAIRTVDEKPHVHFRALGPLSVRGRQQVCHVYQVEWQTGLGQSSELMTVQNSSDMAALLSGADVLGKTITLEHAGTPAQVFRAFDLPISIGRVRSNHVVVVDPRVSRVHARLLWKNGAIVLEDLSSYGTWVRFAGGGSDLLLRRESCVLYGDGLLGLGAGFQEQACPLLRFSAV